MKTLFLTAGLLSMFTLSAPYGHACSCLMPEVRQAFDDAQAVFIGEVIEIVRPRTNNPKALSADRLYRVKFKVEEAWKGVEFKFAIAPEVIILSDQGRAGCFSWGFFVKGEKYLVYTEETKEKNLAVLFSCNRTASLINAADDLKELERMTKPSFQYNSKRIPWLKSSLYVAPNNSFNASANSEAFVCEANFLSWPRAPR